jgi:stage IV sporulation protein FB
MLRWRLFGISFCIEPSFWFINALFAMFLFLDGSLAGGPRGDRTLLVFILVFVLCTLVSVMVHELGHVITGRIFGQPGSIKLSGMGGQAVGGYDELSSWKRMIVIVMGPVAGFTFCALIVAIDSTAWNGFMDWLTVKTNSAFFLDLQLRLHWIDSLGFGEWRRNQVFAYRMTINILTFINLFVNIMNLFPIIPMDGGMLFKEICVLIAPKGGLKFAFAVSVILAGALALFYLDLTLEKYGYLQRRLEEYYPFGLPEFSLVVFLSMTWQCIQAYRQLVVMDRHALYKERDDD